MLEKQLKLHKSKTTVIDICRQEAIRKGWASDIQIKLYGDRSGLSMKSFMIYFLLFISLSLSANEFPIDDRHNSFQFKYPEYKLKAKIVQINHSNQPPKHYKIAKFYGFKFYVPEKFILQYDEGMSALAVRDKNNKGKFLISVLPTNSLLCSDARKNNEKDYCSAFVNQRDLII